MSLCLGYMVPEFPGQTHIFFWREIEALRSLGVRTEIVSTRKPSPVVCKHEFASGAIAETHYVFPPRMSRLLSWTMSGDARLGAARQYVESLAAPGLRLRHAGLLVAAIDLLQWSKAARIDHIHGHSCADAAHVLALARAMGGPPYSLTLHGDLGVYGADHGVKMSGAKFVCAVGRHLVKQIVEQVCIPEARVHSTFMGLQTSALTGIAERRTYDRSGLHLVTVARLHQAKGHLHALAAVHQAKQAGLRIHYSMAGEGPFREAIVARIRELGLEAETSLTGTLSEAEVFDLLSRADAFLLPSIGSGEAWPVSVMEAMSAGLPVVASIIGATPEMIVDGHDGFLVAQGAEQELFELVRRLHGDAALRRRIGNEARMTAARRFDVSATARTLLSAIRRPS